MPLPLGEVSERSEDGEGERCMRPQSLLSRLRRQLSRRERQAGVGEKMLCRRRILGKNVPASRMTDIYSYISIFSQSRAVSRCIMRKRREHLNMVKKHLAAIALFIVLIFGLTSCANRSSDTALFVPVNEKPASTTVDHRTTPDDAAKGSAQSEDAAAPVFPNPRSEQFDLSERDAVLFDAAVAARDRTPNADICIPEIGIYGTYEEAGKTVIVCHVCYHFYYGCDGTEQYTDSGAMQSPAKAVLEGSGDTLQCVSFELAPDGAGTNVWVSEFCGPLTDLANYFLSPEQDEEWPLESVTPSPEQLFHEYIETYQEYIGA